VVVVDVEVVVVDDVVVVVDGAVVTGMVVVVASGGADVEVSSAIDDEVEPESVVDELSSLPQPARAAAKRMKGSRRVNFTGEVWHAFCQLPDQGVGLVPTFNKL
jgi:hypothetical protein